MVLERTDKGLFIVLEGIDKSGKTTQRDLLHNYLSGLNKYNTITTTHEPWQSEEIKRKLAHEKDAYSDGLRCATLFINDGIKHTRELIQPVLNAGGIALCDRYRMSTCAYQWAQRVKVDELLQMCLGAAKDGGIIVPDLTIFVDIDVETALARMNKSNEPPEKFEGKREFTSDLIDGYHKLVHLYNDCYENIFGDVKIIDGRKDIESVHHQIRKAVRPVYDDWDKRRAK